MSLSGVDAPPPPGWYPDARGIPRWWDGARWTEHTQSPPVRAERPRLPDGAPLDSGWVWVVALASFVTVPVLFFIDVPGFAKSYASALLSGEVAELFQAVSRYMAVMGIAMVVSWAVTALSIFAAFRDYRRLISLGVVRPFHWGFAFISVLVYLIGRHVVLRRVARPSGWPLWINIALTALLTIGLTIWIAWITTAMMTEMLPLLRS